MKKHSVHITFLLFCCFLFPATTHAQYNLYGATYQKNVFELNLGQCAVNEINLGYEHFFSEKKSMELNGGLIYRNDLLIKQAEKWSNSQYFYERGFAARLAYRIYRSAGEKSGRKNYMAIGLNYEYLYYPNEWFVTDHDSTAKVKDAKGVTQEGKVTQEIYQHRFRNRIGVQFTMGNIFPMGKAFALEIYYGIGLRGIMSDRYDVAVSETSFGTTKVYDSGNEDKNFYFRPTIHAGIKLRLGW